MHVIMYALIDEVTILRRMYYTIQAMSFERVG